MGRIIVLNHLSIDGVMQAPGRRDEDTSGHFQHGGWAIADPAASEAWGDRMAAAGGLSGWLLGRRTYEDVLGYWTQRDDSPFGSALVQSTKYVASTTMSAPRWPNTTVFDRDVTGQVAELKQHVPGALAIMGSGRLISELLQHELIDELLLMINPVILGSGRRMFPVEGHFTQFRCVNSTLTPLGLLVATFERT